LLLFDIDRTLLASGGAGFRAINRAFAELYGLEDATEGITPDGKTDPMLFREAVARFDGTDRLDGAAIRRLTDRYIELLPEEITAPPARLMPGVRQLLEALEPLPTVGMGLLTGNLELTAYVKLGFFGLDRFFTFGAFGSDSGDRLELPPIAVRRAESLFGNRVAFRDVTVIGDTPRDVACALAWGARAVGVATGRSSRQELHNAGAHVVFGDLSDTGVVLDALVPLRDR
jgi:phosphoglycolate phosphatase-like HAD superfamily hydrolase